MSMTQNTLSESLLAALGHSREQNSSHSRQTASDVPAFTITLSREPWSQGPAVAREVGRRLGWPVYDQELLQVVARKMGTHPRMLELIDEKPMSWLEQCVINLTSSF